MTSCPHQQRRALNVLEVKKVPSSPTIFAKYLGNHRDIRISGRTPAIGIAERRPGRQDAVRTFLRRRGLMAGRYSTRPPSPNVLTLCYLHPATLANFILLQGTLRPPRGRSCRAHRFPWPYEPRGQADRFFRIGACPQAAFVGSVGHGTQQRQNGGPRSRHNHFLGSGSYRCLP